jgi:bilin biosynthesis protein
MASRFDNILGLTEAEAIALLDAPSDQICDGNSRYAAAAHLINFPSARSIEALIRAVQNLDQSLDNRIVRRKSVESLGRLKSVEAIPSIRSCLTENDCYTVENAVWAIGEIGTEDPSILEEIAQLLTQPEQSYRVIIQTLAKLGYRNAVARIRPFIDHQDGPIASAAIAAVSRLTDDIQQMEQILPFLEHSNVYTRRLCIQDMMDAQYHQSIPAIVQCPVSIVFRLRGVRFLCKHALAQGFLSIEQAQNYLEQVLWDHPNTLNMVHEYDQPPTLEFLIRELYETDFGRCYLATQTLLKEYPDSAPAILIENYQNEAYNDYGANYHILKVLGWLEYPAHDIFIEAIHRTEPQFQKSRIAAAIALGKLDKTQTILNLSPYLSTGIWDLRYITLAITSGLAPI